MSPSAVLIFGCRCFVIKLYIRPGHVLKKLDLMDSKKVYLDGKKQDACK